MLKLALKMLIGNQASCIGIIFGIFLATLLISQQSAIFLGLVSRSYRLVSDVPSPDVWVVDPATESDIKARGMPQGYLDIVRSVPNIQWAVPINVMDIPLITPTGVFQVCQLYGVDDASLIGAPQHMLEGSVYDLRSQGAVIVDVLSANGSLAEIAEDGTIIPLKIGDTFEINGHHAVVVGICKVTQGFYPQPIVFTAYSQFAIFTSFTRTNIQFIAAKTTAGSDVNQVLDKINAYPTLNGLTRDQIEWRIAKSFLKTGILINFGLSVALGIIIGFSIAGQIFYILTLENIKYYALIKAMGGNHRMISQMIVVQTAVVGLIGYLLGTGATMLWGMGIQDTTLAFLFPWQLLVFTAIIVLIICIFTASLSIYKVHKTDPIVLMGT